MYQLFHLLRTIEEYTYSITHLLCQSCFYFVRLLRSMKMVFGRWHAVAAIYRQIWNAQTTDTIKKINNICEWIRVCMCVRIVSTQPRQLVFGHFRELANNFVIFTARCTHTLHTINFVLFHLWRQTISDKKVDMPIRPMPIRTFHRTFLRQTYIFGIIWNRSVMWMYH